LGYSQGETMATKQGDPALLQHPVAQELLSSKIPARLAYVASDGSPRVLPIWFHWDGQRLILATSPKAHKIKSLTKNPKVAVTIDDNSFPHKVLLVRGFASLHEVPGIVPEYAAAAERYLGKDQGQAWIAQARFVFPSMVRIAITPEWVGVLDFQTRLPGTLGG